MNVLRLVSEGFSPLERTEWSPYAVGAGIGALSWFTFATANKPLGITTAFENSASLIGEKIAPRLSGANEYIATAEKAPKIDWEWMLAAGVVAGSYLSARASGDRETEVVPKLWARRFGPKPSYRYVGAFVGGALMMFGARMAKGCTSGHGISGTLQLSAASWLFSPIMGAAGIFAARALFGKGK